MKVLFLIDSIKRGGKERRMIELLKGLLKHGEIKPEVVVFSDVIQYQEIHNLGISIHKLVRRFKNDPSPIFSFYKICKRYQPDLIHSWGSMANIYAIPTIKLLGIKFINACVADAPSHSGYMNKKYWTTKVAFPFSDIIIGNSKAGLKAYQAPAYKSRCIYNGFDFRRVQGLQSPETIRKGLGIETEKVVAMVGAFHDRKDYVSYILAAIKLLEKGQQATFLCVGDGPNLGKCKEMVPKALRNRIIFTGLYQQVESLMQILNVGVLATNERVHGEGISNAILEYMALGKPVVATDGGGTPEILQDGVTGFLVKPHSPEDIANRIGYLLNNPTEGKVMGLAGKNHVKLNFSIANMTDTYIQYYEEVTALPPPVSSKEYKIS